MNLFYALDSQPPSLRKGNIGHPVVHISTLLTKQVQLVQGWIFPSILTGILQKKNNNNTEAISESGQSRNHLVFLYKNIFLTCNNKSNYDIPNISCNAFGMETNVLLKSLSICMLFQGCQLMYKIGSLENNLLLETLQLWLWRYIYIYITPRISKSCSSSHCSG